MVDWFGGSSESANAIAFPFKLCAAERILSTTFDYQFPEIVAAAELYLFLVEAFHANNNRDGSSVASDNDSFFLGLSNAVIQRRLFNAYRFHRIPSVVA